MMTKTRRENPRYEVVHGDSVEVLVQRKSDECDETIHGKLRNLSPEGAQILLPTYLKFQEEIELQIHIPDAEVKIEAAAEVSWIRPAEDNQWLIGCSFAEKLSESVLDHLPIARINDQRRHPRHEVSTPGMARWQLDANSIPIRITDYSEGGFCMASGRRSTVGEVVSVEIDAPDKVVFPIFGRVCWQNEQDGEYIIGCSLKHADDSEQLRRLCNVSGDEHRTTSSFFGGQTGRTWFLAAMLVVVLGGSTTVGLKISIESWRSPPTKVWLADAERNSVALASSVSVPHVEKSNAHALLGPRVNITKAKEAFVVGEEDSDAEREAVAALKKLGAQITGGHSVTLTNNTKITDADLGHLKKMTSLRRLLLDGTKVTGSGLEHLEGLTDLMRLYLNNSKVTDAGLEPLQRLTGLEDLRIHHTSVTDKGLDHLKGLTNLKLLFLPEKTTDAGLEYLKNMTAMKNLGLKGTQVTGPGLRHIKGMTNLKRLWLNGTKVSDASLAHLKELNRLTMLELDDTKVSDAGLVHLQGMKTLKELSLQNTKVSQEGIDKLKEALPDCKIEYP